MNSNLTDWQICMPTSLSVCFTVRRLGRLFMALVIEFLPALHNATPSIPPGSNARLASVVTMPVVFRTEVYVVKVAARVLRFLHYLLQL
jgi:hypothetical protein